MKTALLVIDVQESFRHRPYWQERELRDFVVPLQQLIDDSRAAGIPVVQVFHEEPGDLKNPFDPATGHVRTLAEVNIAPTAVFRKTVHSAMFGKDASGTTLEQWLRDHGIQRLIVTGIRTEQCCETTTRHASDLGFDVRYVTEATLTFPMLAANGREYSPADIRERTELVLAGRFATITSARAALG